MQRLQAFGNGNFPSYVELKNHFYTHEQTEDNFLYQFNKTDQDAVAIGD